VKAIILLFLFLFPFCGGVKIGAVEEEGEKKPPPKPPVQQKQAQISEAAAKPNTRWLIIKPYFYSFLGKPLQGKVNIFKSNLASFAPRIETLLEEVEKQKVEAPKGPLEFFDVDSYKLQLILSGTAVPKALVTDPKGKAHVIQEGIKIGNREGKVESITQYQVKIIEPGKSPYIKQIEQPETAVSQDMFESSVQ